MDTSHVVMVDIRKEKAWIGSYIDGNFYPFYFNMNVIIFVFSDGIRTKLTNAHKFPIKEYADAGCIKRLNVPIKNHKNKKTIEV